MYADFFGLKGGVAERS